MKDKYLAYWSDIPMLYSFAFILDPRAKTRGFTNVLRILCNLNGTYYSCYLTEVRVELSVIFAKRDSKFGSVRLPKGYTTGPRGKKKIAWSKIFGEEDCSGGAGLVAGLSVGGLGAGLCAGAGLGARARQGAGESASSLCLGEVLQVLCCRQQVQVRASLATVGIICGRPQNNLFYVHQNLLLWLH